MITISGIVSAVSVLIVLAVSAALVKQKYDLESDYNTKVGNLTKQVNDINKVNAQFDEKQQLNIVGTEGEISDVRKKYVRKDELSKDVVTTNLKSDNAVFTNTESKTGLKITNDNPGPLVEKSYNPSPYTSDRYGISHNDGNTRMYASGAKGDSTVNMSFAESDGKYKDILQLKRNGTNATLSLDGQLALNNNMVLDASDASNLKLMDRTGKSIAGTLNVDKVNIADMTNTNNAAIANSLSVKAGAGDYSSQSQNTVFNGPDGMNYIRGNTNVFGNTNNIGDVNIGQRVFFGNNKMNNQNGQESSIFMQRNPQGLSVSLLAPGTAPAPQQKQSQQWYAQNQLVHELDSDGKAVHRSLHLTNNTNMNNMYFEAGRTADGNNEGMSAINFNGMTKNGDVLVNNQKSRWRIGTDQTLNNDYMFYDQTLPGGAKRTYAAFINNKVGVGTSQPESKLHVVGGDISQQSTASGPKFTLGTSGANEGVLGYDGSSIAFSSKGTKLMTLGEDGSVSVPGKLTVSKNVNVTDYISASNMWLENTIGMVKKNNAIRVVNDGGNRANLEVDSLNANGATLNTNLLVSGPATFQSSMVANSDASFTNNLTVDGTTTLKGAFTLNNGSMMLDAGGNLVLAPNPTKEITIGNTQTGKIAIGKADTTDIVIGKNNSFQLATDGNTYIRAAKPNADIYIGDDKPDTVVIGEKANENQMGKDAIANMIGRSGFPRADGHVNIVPTATNKDIFIGTNNMVSNVKLGNIGTKVTINEQLCLGDVCITPQELLALKQLQSKPAMSLTNTDVTNIQSTLPKFSSVTKQNVNDLKALTSKPAWSLTSGDVTNIQKIPYIIKQPALTLTDTEVSNIRYYISQPPTTTPPPTTYPPTTTTYPPTLQPTTTPLPFTTPQSILSPAPLV